MAKRKLPVADLHAAFAFDCAACGQENFVRAFEAEFIDETVATKYRKRVAANFYRTIAEASEEGADIATGYISSVVAVCAPRVTCGNCGEKFRCRISFSEPG